MLTFEEVEASEINPKVVREALAQAEKRLKDVLETRESHDKKAFELLRAYVTLSVAALGAAGFFLASHQLSLGAPLFLVGAALAVRAIKAQTYGSVGSSPSMWLRRGVVDGGNVNCCSHSPTSRISTRTGFKRVELPTPGRTTRSCVVPG